MKNIHSNPQPIHCTCQNPESEHRIVRCAYHSLETELNLVKKRLNSVIESNKKISKLLESYIEQFGNQFDEYYGHEVYNKEFGCVLWCQKCLDSEKENS